MAQELQVGAKVKVAWGLEEDVEGRVIDIWGDPPSQIRVQLFLGQDEDEEPVVLLLSPSVVKAA
jgi:hypothetical protein